MKFLKSKKIPKGINEVPKKKLAQGVKKLLWGEPKCPGKKATSTGSNVLFPKKGPNALGKS